MDEYLTDDDRWVELEHPLSFRGFMDRRSTTWSIRSLPRGRRTGCFPTRPGAIRELIDRRGGVDACFGGIGINGHIAFNEPPDAAVTVEAFRDFRTRVLPISTGRGSSTP